MTQEFPQPPPTQPEGTTNLPNFQLPAPTEQQMQDIQRWPAAEQETLLTWWPYVYGHHSNYLGRIVTTCEDVLQHAQLHTTAQQQREQAQAAQPQQPTFTERWNAWREQCTLRKAWIAERKDELRKRKEAMADVLRAMEDTKRMWEAYVEEAKRAYDEAKATPAPAQPKR